MSGILGFEPGKPHSLLPGLSLVVSYLGIACLRSSPGGLFGPESKSRYEILTPLDKPGLIQILEEIHASAFAWWTVGPFFLLFLDSSFTSKKRLLSNSSMAQMLYWFQVGLFF